MLSMMVETASEERPLIFLRSRPEYAKTARQLYAQRDEINEQIGAARSFTEYEQALRRRKVNSFLLALLSRLAARKPVK